MPESVPDLPDDVQELLAVLPHGPSMVMLDGIEEASSERVVAVRRVEEDEFWVDGHFPGDPVMPAVLLIEVMAQACAILHFCNERRLGVLYLGRSRARFHHPVRPGDDLRIVATRVKSLPRMLVAEAEVLLGDRVVAGARLHFGAPV